MTAEDPRARVMVRRPPRQWRCCVLWIAAIALGHAGPASAQVASDRSEARQLPGDLERWLHGVQLLHTSRVDEALEWFQTRQRERPDDVCGHYFAAFVYANFDVDRLTDAEEDLCGRTITQEGIEMGQDLLDGGVRDGATRYCLGALYGLRAADRLNRAKYMGAALDAKRSRRIMLDLLDDEPICYDCRFWTGAYDYFADVLPGIIRFFRSLLFFPSGDKERGIAALRDVAERGTLDRFNALWVLYRIYRGPESDLGRSREVLERLCTIYPDCIDARLALAWHHARREVPPDRERGIALHMEALERAATIDGMRDGRLAQLVSVSLARAYLDDLRPDDAVATLQPVLPASRGHADREFEATGLMIVALNQSGRHADAVSALNTWVARQPDSPRLEELKGLTHEFNATTSRIYYEMTAPWRLGRKGDLNGAESVFHKVRAKHRAEGLIRYGMATMYFDVERFEVAELHYRSAVESGIEGPTYFLPTAYLRIGNLLDLRGQRGAAKSFYRKASSASGDHAGIREAAKRYLQEPYSRPERDGDR